MITDFINYLIRSSLALLILYLFYYLILGREKIYRFNRFYLLIALIFSFIVPLFTYPGFIASSSLARSFDMTGFQDSFYQVKTLSMQKSGTVNSDLAILTIYSLISLILLVRFIINLLKIKLHGSGQPTLLIKGHRIVLMNKKILPYSFFSTVYVNKEEYMTGHIPSELFDHEFTHISQKHSVDIIFIELIKVFFWFNPILIFYRNAIMLNHEYLADFQFTSSKSSFNSYRDILLNTAFRNSKSYLASSFNYSFTKKRLLMMTNNTLSKTAFIKMIVVLPLFLLTGLFVTNAQEGARHVVTHMEPPPPPPPPPPLGYNAWWSPVLKENNVTPDPSKSYYSQNFFETANNLTSENGNVTLEGDVFIAIRSTDDIYRIIKCQSAVYNAQNKTIEAEYGKIETCRTDGEKTTIIKTEKFKKTTFSLVEDNSIAPPPPPPPLPGN
jgi:beta-lactamase regulating signal transducer with metallopeptidase domain